MDVPTRILNAVLTRLYENNKASINKYEIQIYIFMHGRTVPKMPELQQLHLHEACVLYELCIVQTSKLTQETSLVFN